jgi:DNA-binding GntR family transcriptional regulator
MSMLKERYQTGATPLREALARLSVQGLVELEPQCGGRVPELSSEELHDIYRIREAIMELALELIISNNDDEWEAALVSSWHRLSKYLSSSSKIDVHEWEERQKDFFHILVKGARSPWLLKIHDMLFMQAARYRLLCINTHSTNKKVLADYLAENQNLVDALLSKNLNKTKKIFAEIWKNTVAQIDSIMSKKV